MPAKLREAAFALEQGRVSPPIQVDNWVHLLYLEEKVPAAAVTIDAVRDQLIAQLRDQKADQLISQLARQLFEQAKIEIRDPQLEKLFEQQYPAR